MKKYFKFFETDESVAMPLSRTKRLVLAAFFLALGLVLPFLTGQIQLIGNMLCPMHIPVMLCGLICGWQFGLAVGFITPIMRSFLFGMPILFPNAVSMSFELATYGFVIGFLFLYARWQCVKSLLRCLIISMIAGRIVWGISQCILLGLGSDGFTLKMFLTAGLLNAIPGIILQIIVIPAVMLALNKTHLVPFRQNSGLHCNKTDELCSGK